MCLTLDLIHNIMPIHLELVESCEFPSAQGTLINFIHELPITPHNVIFVQELFPLTVMMDDGDTGENEEFLTAHGLEKP